MTEETIPSDVPTPRMLSWARNSTIYRLERRMMTEKQLFDAITRKAKEKFEDISAAQLKAVADFAVNFAYDNKAIDDSAYAKISTRSAVRSGKSKQRLNGLTISMPQRSLPASVPSGLSVARNSTKNGGQKSSPPSPATASASRSAGRSST